MLLVFCFVKTHTCMERPAAGDVALREGGEGEWPLLSAVKREDLALVRSLFEQGARSRRDQRGRSELHALADLQSGPFPLVRACTSPPVL